MNVVRLFTISAASIGLAIAAGSLFQPDPADAPVPEMASGTDQIPAEPGQATLAGGLTARTGGVTLAGRSATTPADADIMADAAPVTGSPDAARPDVSDGEVAGQEPKDTPILANLTEIETAVDASSLSDDELAELLAQASACAVWLVVTPEPAAMLDMSLYAPCDANQAISVSHGPLRLAGQIGPDGMLMMTIPALSPMAEVAVQFEDGRSESDMTDVPDFGMFPRVVVQWDGPSVLDLHAYAGGADWGQPGHVQAGGAISASTGFVSVVPSDDQAQVRIYTFPAGVMPESGVILLEAEVAITEASCARPFAARVHMVRDDGPISRRDIQLDMPACDAVGGFVLLPDVLPEDQSGVAALN